MKTREGGGGIRGSTFTILCVDHGSLRSTKEVKYDANYVIVAVIG